MAQHFLFFRHTSNRQLNNAVDTVLRNNRRDMSIKMNTSELTDLFRYGTSRCRCWQVCFVFVSSLFDTHVAGRHVSQVYRGMPQFF
jgi:hypothetical protein